MQLSKVSRRSRSGFVIALALTTTLAACGSDDDASADADIESTGSAVPVTTSDEPAVTSSVDPDAEDRGSTSVPSTVPDPSDIVEPTNASGSQPGRVESTEGEMRTVEHALGTSEVPVDPERIVVVDRRGTLAFALELGLEPVGALEAGWLFGEPFHPLIADRAEVAGVEPIDGTDGPNLEEIAALRPDLIIGNVRDMFETEDRLAEIAPTVGLTWNFADPLQNAVAIGEALGRPEEAHAMVDEFETDLEEAAASSADPGTVSIIGLFGPDDIRIYREANLYGRLTVALGGRIVPTEEELPLDPEDGEVNFVSLEQIGLASGQRIISLVNRSPEEADLREEVERQAIVQTLPGFENDQVLVADPQLAFGAAGTAGVRQMLDQLVDFYSN